MATATRTRKTTTPRKTKAEQRAARAVHEGTADFTATHQTAAAEAAARTMKGGAKGAVERGEIDPPTAEFVTRKIGPLPCRFPADMAAASFPTIKSLATQARTVLNAKAGVHGEMDAPLRRKKLLEPQPTRDAAAFATAVLIDPKTGEKYTLAKRAPLTTLVRKELVTQLRAEFKAKDKADAEAKRQEAARTREAEKIREREVAKALRTVKVAVLPEGAKLSKSTSKDQTRPVLTNVHLTQTDDGGWQLVGTDSYQACIFPLTVHGDAGLVDCLLEPETIKAIEKAGAFRIDSKSKQVVPCSYQRTTRMFPRPSSGGSTQPVAVQLPEAHELSGPRYAIVTDTHFPRMRDDGKKGRAKKGEPTPLHLKPAPAPSKRIEMTFNPHLLAQITEAVGDKKHGVTIVFSLDDFTKAEDGHREWALDGREANGVKFGPTIRVEGANGARGHLMPVRPTK